jgi:hypothetical protein
MHHFNLVTFAQRGGGVLAARHDIQIELNRHAASGQIQTANQPGDGFAVGQFECFTV